MNISGFGSLQILHLLAKCLDDVLHCEAGCGQLDIVRLGAGGIDLAIELLRQEIEPTSDRPALADDLASLCDMGRDAVELLADICLGRDQERLLVKAVDIEAVGYLKQRRDLFGEPSPDGLRLATGRG